MRIVYERAAVRVPATTANMGPGFDSFGMAFRYYDEVSVRPITGTTRVIVEGVGAETVPTDDDNLVVQALRAGLDAVGAPQAGFEMRCVNRIPHGGGMGSSASAAVAGLMLARGLIAEPEALSDDRIFALATDFEGHPDNAGASALGGAVVSWTDIPVDGQSKPSYRAVRIPVDDSIKAVALVPNFHASTNAVRKVLPSHVTHTDARFNVSRTAVMTAAIQHHPELLFEGTRDRLHQPYRADVLPVTAEWVNRLRNRGHAAYLSGAGPTALVLTTSAVEPALLDEAREAGLRVIELDVAGPATAELVRD